jgi:citrate lyase beta subunit
MTGACGVADASADAPDGAGWPGEAAQARRRVHYLAMGASLYTPATRTDLRALFVGEHHPMARSVVACTEDAIDAGAVKRALSNLRASLYALGASGPLRFVRPRDPQVLADLLANLLADGSIAALDGVCLPKLDQANIGGYLEVLNSAPQLAIMPIIETEIAFSVNALQALRQRLDKLRGRIVCIRIGGNDLLQLMGMRRPRDMTAYDTPLRRVIDNMIIAFRPAGYDLSAPVYEHIACAETLAREVALDVEHGLLAKTAIHPAQIPLIEAAYAVPAEDAAMAQAVLDPDAAAVFRFNGSMAEPATHRRWAARTLEREAVYGRRAEPPMLAYHDSEKPGYCSGY